MLIGDAPGSRSFVWISNHILLPPLSPVAINLSMPATSAGCSVGDGAGSLNYHFYHTAHSPSATLPCGFVIAKWGKAGKGVKNLPQSLLLPSFQRKSRQHRMDVDG